MSGVGPSLVAEHLGAMDARSREPQEPITEVEGFRIVKDVAYQGFDGGLHPWWTAPRFWCRSITVQREADGATGWGVGPQAEAYRWAVSAAQRRTSQG